MQPHAQPIEISQTTQYTELIPFKKTQMHSGNAGQRFLKWQRWTTSRQFSSATSYQDPVLAWASQNQSEAEECLQQPIVDIANCDASFADKKSESFESYALWRRWPHSSRTSPLHQNSIAITSHVLSAPLTLGDFKLSINNVSSSTRLCVVGARAEATIPQNMWKEYLLYTEALAGHPSKTSIDFIGPDIRQKTRDTSVHLENGSDISFKWYYRGYLHDLPETSDDSWDAFIFLNPGFGHPHLTEGWDPTLRRVLALDKPLLLTAHSQKDFERDSQLLQQYGIQVEYKRNAFGSRITYQDPFDESHILSPNKYVADLLP